VSVEKVLLLAEQCERGVTEVGCVYGVCCWIYGEGVWAIDCRDGPENAPGFEIDDGDGVLLRACDVEQGFFGI
jgi:hypothetical protein